MKTLYKIFPFALVLFPLAGCGATSPGKLSTPSGRPEVIIPNSNIQAAMDGVAAWLAELGKPVSETGVYTITTSFAQDNYMGFSIGYYTSIYTIVQKGSNVEIFEKLIRNGSGELTEQSNYEDIQKDLGQIAEFIKSTQ